MREKADWHIYLNNVIAFIIFKFLSLFLKKSRLTGNNILFINTGQIGDLIISSVIFDNSSLFETGINLYFLINNSYIDLFHDYSGSIKILKWNYNLYKYNPFYRVQFLLRLHRIGFKKTINLTAARGITNDELALLSGAQEVICLNSNWKYLKKLFGKKMDSLYNKILNFDSNSEFEKHVAAIKILTDVNPEINTMVYINRDTEKRVEKLLKGFMPDHANSSFITIAPMTDLSVKNWSITNYYKLIDNILSMYDLRVLLIGSNKQHDILERLTNLNKSRVINLAGKFTLIESAAIVKISILFIGNDSGFTHIAKALNKKYIGIIGGGSYYYFFPYNSSPNEALLYSKMDCFGCEWKCKFDKPYCHHNVSVDDVMKAIKKFLPVHGV